MGFCSKYVSTKVKPKLTGSESCPNCLNCRPGRKSKIRPEKVKVNMIKISAVIITLNEEKNLPRCLDSLSGIVDEIVVIDSFSSDRTQAICEDTALRDSE